MQEIPPSVEPPTKNPYLPNSLTLVFKVAADTENV